MRRLWSRSNRSLASWVLACGLALAALTAASAPDPRANVGPYNASFLEGGVGLTRPLAADMPLLGAGAPWSISGWINPSRERTETIVIAAIGDAPAATCRCLLLQGGKLALGAGGGALLASDAALPAKQWTHVAATYDGSTARLYVDGREVLVNAIAPHAATAAINLAPHVHDRLIRAFRTRSRSPRGRARTAATWRSTGRPPLSRVPLPSRCAAGTSSRLPPSPRAREPV